MARKYTFWFYFQTTRSLACEFHWSQIQIVNLLMKFHLDEINFYGAHNRVIKLFAMVSASLPLYTSHLLMIICHLSNVSVNIAHSSRDSTADVPASLATMCTAFDEYSYGTYCMIIFIL